MISCTFFPKADPDAAMALNISPEQWHVTTRVHQTITAFYYQLQDDRHRTSEQVVEPIIIELMFTLRVLTIHPYLDTCHK